MSDLQPLMIENHDAGTKYYPVRKFVYQLVHETTQTTPSRTIYGRFLYKTSPKKKDRGFYHVSIYNLDEPWWRKPTTEEKTLLKARYGDDLVF